MIRSWANKSQLRLCPNFWNIGKLNLSIIGDQRYLKAYAKPAQLNRVIVLLSTLALDNQTDKVEKTKSIGKPEEKPNIIIFKGFSVKKNKNLLFNYLLQKEGKKIINNAKISNLPNIIPIDNNHLDPSGRPE